VTFVTSQVLIGPSNDGRRHGRGTYLLQSLFTFFHCFPGALKIRQLFLPSADSKAVCRRLRKHFLTFLSNKVIFSLFFSVKKAFQKTKALNSFVCRKKERKRQAERPKCQIYAPLVTVS
jgi:hypothetical protein